MRISTNTIYDSGAAQLGDLQTGVVKTQQQLSTGRRILTPADDPIASSRALEVTQSQSVNTQFGVNRQSAKTSLALVEQALASVTSILQDVQTLAINGGDGALSSADRASLGTALSGSLDDLLGLANSSDGAGSFLFAGFQTAKLPFTKTVTGAQYQGDQGQRLLQVDSSRQIPTTDSGSAVFESNLTGNGTFVTAAAAANTGSGIVSSGSVTNTALLTGHNYDITFTVLAGVTTYDVLDTTTGLPVSAANPYTSGQPIAFDGLQFDVTGSPADTDKFTVSPSINQSIFTTLTNLITTLNTPATGAAGQAKLANGLNTASDNVNKALDNVLTIRSTVGSRLKELDSLDSASSDLDIQYKQTLSNLQDLDYIKSLSNFAQQQTTLEAAQKSFIKVTGLSLFDFIR